MDLKSPLFNSLLQTARSDKTKSSYSYTIHSNASLQLLKADFLAFTLLHRGNLLKHTSLNISTSPTSESKSSLYDTHQNESDKPTENTKNFDLKKLKILIHDISGFRGSYFNSKLSQKHQFLECFRNSHIYDQSESHYKYLFYQFENYVIKLFSIHPTLGSLDRGIYIDNDGSMIFTCMEYIRSYESAMHLLSKKPQSYFYLSTFLLIVLLRNLRRFLHHYKANSTFVELVLILVEGVSMCQNHLYNTFLLRNKLLKRSPINKYTDVLLEDDFYFDNLPENTQPSVTSLEKLRIHNNNCNKYRDFIFRSCKNEFNCSKQKIDSDRSTCYDEDENSYPLHDNSSHQSFTDTFYDNISELSTNRCGPYNSELEYDKSEIFHLSDFNLVVDDKVSMWISEMCSICNLYCRLGKGPILLTKQFTKITLNHENPVIPMLCCKAFTNLSCNRTSKIRSLMSHSTYKPSKSKVPSKHEKLKKLKYDEYNLSNGFRSTGEPNNKKPSTTPDKLKAEIKYTQKKSKYNRWESDDVELLLMAVNRHGIGKWTLITKTYFQGKKSPMQLKDKWINLTRYNHVVQVDHSNVKVDQPKNWILV